MKIQIKNYTFNKTAKTVTFTDYTSIDLDGILLITNVTSNKIIYNFAKIGGTVLNNVLTLDYDTSLMSDNDDLQIFYEDGQTSTDVFNEESLWLLRRMVKLMESNGTVDILNRQKVIVDAIPTIYGGYTVPAGMASVPTGNAPTMNGATSYFLQTWAGPVDPRWTNIEQAKINYNTGVRNNLSFS